MISAYAVNLILIVILVLFGLILIYLRLTSRPIAAPKPTQDLSRYSIEAMQQYVKQTIHDMVSGNLYDLGLHEEEFRRRKNQRTELKKALKGCVYGDARDKAYVKNLIYDLLAGYYGCNENNVDWVIPFEDNRALSEQDQFDILLYLYRKRHGIDALGRLIETYRLDRPKRIIEDGTVDSYRVTGDEIRTIFEREYRTLAFEDKLNIVVQRIYQQYKGFGVIDEIRDMQIDGVSGGVSGLSASEPGADTGFGASYYTDQMKRDTKYSYDSVWVFYKGKSIHLDFLSFGSELELKRVCQNIYKYNNPGQLSESNGYKVNEMKDGSRVVVIRPNFSESWAFFVRKFDVPNATLEQLIRDVNASLPIKLIQYLMKGCRITAITGAQGSGKTTLLMAMVKHIYATYTLRVQEMSFELNLRKIYRDRNILSFRETETISGQQGLDIQKKTDGTVNILGEVATDPVAAWMIQMAQVASLFTLFTHHAKTFRDLVQSLRNSLLKTGVFTSETAAEQQVISVVNFDIHLKKDSSGRRYIERITECVPIADGVPYADARNVIEYREGGYVAVQPISDRNRREMIEHMSEADEAEFKLFLSEHWGEVIGA